MIGLSGTSTYRPQVRNKLGRHFDLWLLLSAVILIGFSLLSLYSFGIHKDNGVSFHKQVFNIIIGLVPAALFATVKPRVWLRSANLLYVINLLGLIAVLRLGAHRNGSARWIEMGPIQFQPSEMAKILTVLTLAAFYATRQDKMDRISTFLLGLLHVAVPMFLILKQPHVGGAMVIGVIWLAVSLASNVPGKYLAAAGAVALVGTAIVVAFPSKFPEIFHGYHDRRLEAFKNGSSSRGNDRTIDYQTNQARIAFGVGGVVGAGVGKGEQGSYIPEQQTDFVFTIAGEELGLIGCTLALAAYGFLFYRIWLGMLYATDPFYKMIVSGILGMLAFHTFVNLFMVTQMLPVIGLWLPFMSYGGTAMWLCMSSVALVLNIRSREEPLLF